MIVFHVMDPLLQLRLYVGLGTAASDAGVLKLVEVDGTATGTYES